MGGETRRDDGMTLEGGAASGVPVRQNVTSLIWTCHVSTRWDGCMESGA